MRKNCNGIVNGIVNNIVNDIAALIRVPTVYDAASATESMPYGKNVHAGYQWLKEKALKDGFEVLEYGGHALAIRIPGKATADRIDVVAHVDVVEPGVGWDCDPFGGIVADGHIVGRGAQDMKAALMLTYYALKSIKDNGIPCKREVRVVIGCDEERTMGDIKHYISKAGEPAFAFTPDGGRFPYSLGEKGALMLCIDGCMDSCIEELDGGVQCNVVSPAATALINDWAYVKYKEILSNTAIKGEILREGGKLRINIAGKAAHASKPEDGDNAAVRLLGLIASVGRDPLAELLYNCFYDYNGKGAGIDYDIEPMGKLTLNLGVLKIKDKTISAQVDCRYPYGVTSDVIGEKLQKALKPLKVAIKYDDRPTMADKDSPYLKILLDTYREVSGDNAAGPVIHDGVTYSKAIKNCVAFGPLTGSDIMLAHQANERFELDKIGPLFEIYLKAMIRLANL